MKKIKTFSIKRWNRLVEKRYPILYNDLNNMGKLRLILGVGRSGTSWLAKSLSYTETPIRYVHEAYPHVRTKYLTNNEGDPLAMPFTNTLADNHPFLLINKMLCSDYFTSKFFLKGYYERKMPRSNRDFQVVIHKEVHALLASKALLDKLSCPVVFITRNPVYVIDSLLSYKDISTPIWRNEQKFIKNEAFLFNYFNDNKHEILRALKAFPDDGIKRKNVIIGKSLTVAVINSYLKSLGKSYNNAKHVKYENLCYNTYDLIQQLADFFSISFGQSALNSLTNTLTDDGTGNHTSIQKNSFNQPHREFKVLSYQENQEVVNVLNACGLYEY